MLNIILCDDDKNDREELRQNIGRYFFDRDDVVFECYKDGAELVNILENDKKLDADIIFLDIKMPVLDGIFTAQKLRKHGIKSAIIFVTKYSDWVFQGYEVHAYDYLLKPVTEKKIEKVLTRYLEELEQEEKNCFIMKRNGKRERIQLKQVEYFLSEKRKMKAVLESSCDSIEFYMKMREVEEQKRKKRSPIDLSDVIKATW